MREKIDRDDLKGVTIWMPSELMDRLDVLSFSVKISRSRLALNLVQVGVDEMEAMDKVGILAAARGLRDFGDWFKKQKRTRIKVNAVIA